ncbi:MULTISPECIES: iron ABC transporter ATP-binding protein FetA [unclassified Serratia (in: enterobacteria)]|uniref:iron efflux ABC transporter ATP-binding subunit FetA n=1 Tax=unclassified Serratia (in: enterobacteria) TaxID=2647522 RepID=UPI0004698D15|nr:MULTISPECIES: iron ABC transporter ATP-binding protein FetA [unclassified Serratia (in: enterobacteria)]
MKGSNEILVLEGVHYQIDEQVILDAVSFTLKLGEFKLITGPSGCGKSTLLKIVSSLLSPIRGSITFNGKNIDDIAPEEYRKQVSYCSQTPVLFGNTVYDNLALPYQIRQLKPDEKKMHEGLAQLALPDSMLKKGIDELSGGEKQRISLIRNLQFMPKVLLLDEITSALDEDNKRNVNELIQRLVADQGLAVLWVTHDKDEIEHADEVITLPVSRVNSQESPHESA